MEYNCNLITQISKEKGEMVFQTKVLGPIICREDTDKSILFELMSQGFIQSTRLYVKRTNHQILVVDREDDVPVIELIPMV